METTSREPAPVTPDRISKVLTQRGWLYQIDTNGVISGLWDNFPFWFVILGERNEVLQVRGQWNKNPDRVSVLPLLHSINEMHSRQVFPKAFIVPLNGNHFVVSEQSINIEKGLTDEQLQHFINMAMSGVLALFHNLDSMVKPLDEHQPKPGTIWTGDAESPTVPDTLPGTGGYL